MIHVTDKNKLFTEKPIPASVKIILKWIHKILKRTVTNELMDCLMKC